MSDDPRLDRLLAKRAAAAAQPAETDKEDDPRLARLLAKRAAAAAPQDNGIPDVPDFVKYNAAEPAPSFVSYQPRPSGGDKFFPGSTLTRGQADEYNKRMQELATPTGALKHFGGDIAASALNMLAGPEAGAAEAGAPFAAKAAMAAKNALKAGAHGAATGAANAAAEGSDVGQGAAGGALIEAGVGPVARVASSVGKSLGSSADKMLTHVFMSPQQREKYAVKHGSDALETLGREARDVGLFKSPTLLGNFRPANAARVASNAERISDNLHGQMQGFEDNLVAGGVNPNVDVAPVVKQLREQAAQIEKNFGTQNNADAKFLQAQADDIESKAVAATKKYREPVQQSLEGVDTAAKPAQKGFGFRDHAETQPIRFPSTEPDAQTAMSLPRAEKPEPWKPGDIRNASQAALPLERSGQVPMKLDEQGQAGFAFENPSQKRQAVSGGSEEAPLFPGEQPRADVNVTRQPRDRREETVHTVYEPKGKREVKEVIPGRPAETTPRERLPQPETSASQQHLDLATQKELPLPPRSIAAPWQPGDLSANAEQQAFSGMDQPIRDQLRVPGTAQNAQVELPLPAQVPERDVPTGELHVPFDQAMRSNRALGKRINWSKNPFVPQPSYVQDMGEKFIYGGTKDAAEKALDNAVAGGNVQKAALDTYRKQRKDLHTSLTALEPALRTAEKQDKIGPSLAGMIAGHVVGGAPGAVVGAIAKQSNGSTAAAASRATRMFGGAFSGAGNVLHEIAQAGGQIAGNTAPEETVKDRNERMSSNLKKRLEGEVE
jgi:hypothetical protein